MNRDLLKALGPGVLFTGTAVGVSHLVQSTRAGALYGVALVGLVVVANLVKYPAFRFGPMYAAATGTSMLEGYRRQGRWALIVYGLLTLGTMFTVQAGVTIVTAGLAGALLGLHVSPLISSGAILVVCVILVATGGYRALDKVGKVVVSFLALSTVVATVLILPRVPWGGAWWPTRFEATDIAFMAALIGWMPSAIDVSVWQSLWTLARGAETGGRPEARSSAFDFHLGYVGTAGLAVCFVLLGAAVLHGEGELPGAPAQFASRLISLYVEALGDWSRPVIGGAALATMFSTTLMVVDGFPRALAVLVARLRRPEDADAPEPSDRTPAYWASLALLFVGSLAILAFFLRSMSALIDLATTLSFLSAPVLSLLNHRAVTSDAVPQASRPARWLVIASLVAIALQAVFAVGFLGITFAGEPAPPEGAAVRPEPAVEGSGVADAGPGSMPEAEAEVEPEVLFESRFFTVTDASCMAPDDCLRVAGFPVVSTDGARIAALMESTTVTITTVATADPARRVDLLDPATGAAIRELPLVGAGDYGRWAETVDLTACDDAPDDEPCDPLLTRPISERVEAVEADQRARLLARVRAVAEAMGDDASWRAMTAEGLRATVEPTEPSDEADVDAGPVFRVTVEREGSPRSSARSTLPTALAASTRTSRPGSTRGPGRCSSAS